MQSAPVKGAATKQAALNSSGPPVVQSKVGLTVLAAPQWATHRPLPLQGRGAQRTLRQTTAAPDVVAEAPLPSGSSWIISLSMQVLRAAPTLLRGTRLVRIKEDRYEIAVAEARQTAWLKHRLKRVVVAALAARVGQNGAVRFVG